MGRGGGVINIGSKVTQSVFAGLLTVIVGSYSLFLRIHLE